MSATIARVVVALDAAAEPAAAIDTAVRLAASAKVPLHAVFVEDQDLLTVAALPIARHIVPGAGTRPMLGHEIELQLRSAAASIREILVLAAQEHAVGFSFEILRGDAETMLASVSERDLVIAAARARPFAGHFRAKCRWLAAAQRATGPILLAQREAEVPGAVAALIGERGPGSIRLLQAAARLAELNRAQLAVVVRPALALEEGFRDWVAAQIEPARVPLEIAPSTIETADLHRLVTELGCQLLALDAATIDAGRLAELAGSLACDILVVR